MFDLIIRGGTVYDGAGRPGIQADVAVSGGRIAAVEPLPGPPGPPGSSTPGANG